MEPQKPLIAKAILRKTEHDFRQYYKAAVIKTTWYWHQKKKQTNRQLKRIENL